MAADEELVLALAKGLVGSAANLALPGLGSLLSVGVARFTDNQVDIKKQISVELVTSFGLVVPKKKTSWIARGKNLFSGSEKKEAGRLLSSGIGINNLLETAGQTMDEPCAGVAPELSDAEKEDWAALGKAQLAMVSSPSFVPGVWQDEFAALLQALAEKQLDKGAPDRDRWRQLLGLEKDEETPKGAQLTDLMRTVTRVFAARMEANTTLAPLAEELRQSDRSAMQYALLYRLDQQRQSLQLIAAVLVAFAAALGIGFDVVE